MTEKTVPYGAIYFLTDMTDGWGSTSGNAAPATADTLMFQPEGGM